MQDIQQEQHLLQMLCVQKMLHMPQYKASTATAGCTAEGGLWPSTSVRPSQEL